MNVVDLHPEDLLDKEAEGTLSDEERLRLDAHLRACVACRFERSVRLDFDAELDAERPSSMQLLVAGALRSAATRPAEPAASPAPAPPAPTPPAEPPAAELPAAEPPAAEPPRVAARSSAVRRWARRPALMLAAALALTAGAAAASSGVVSHLWNFSTRALTGEPAPVELSPAPPKGKPQRAHAASAASAAAPAAPTAAPAEPSAAPTEPAPTEPAPTAAPTAAAPAAQGDATTASLSRAQAPREVAQPRAEIHAAVPGQTSPRAGAPEATAPKAPEAKAPEAKAPEAKAPEAKAPEAKAPEAVEVETAASLFERANAARRRGALAEASSLYQQLQSKHPASAEAQLSTVLAARAHLDQGNAAAALAGFEAYLRAGRGALREEAMAGRAMALGRLGRVEQEQIAWAALLSAFPRTGYASLASKRMAQPPR